MKINGKQYTLAKTTFADINAIAPLKDIETWHEVYSLGHIGCETDAIIDVEGMRFRPSFLFKTEDLEAPYDTALLAEMYLHPVEMGEEFVANIIKWKNKIFKRYACILQDQEEFWPFYSVEISYPDESEDMWRLTMKINAASLEYDIKIEVE